MHFMAVKKSRKRSSFVIYSHFMDSAFTIQQLKGMEGSKIGM